MSSLKFSGVASAKKKKKLSKSFNDVDNTMTSSSRSKRTLLNLKDTATYPAADTVPPRQSVHAVKHSKRAGLFEENTGNAVLAVSHVNVVVPSTCSLSATSSLRLEESKTTQMVGLPIIL